MRQLFCSILTLLYTILLTLSVVNAFEELEQSSTHLLRRRFRSNHEQQQSTIQCRITLVHTTYINQHDNSNTDDEEQTHCIPIVNGIEVATMFPIALPIFVQDNYQNKINQGTLIVSITNAKIGMYEINLTNDSKFTIHNNNDKIHQQQQKQEGRELQQQQQQQQQSKDFVWKDKMTFAIVRISTIDSSPTDTISDLEYYYTKNEINFRNQYKSCSFGKLQWDLAINGIIDIQVNQSIYNFTSAGTLVATVQTLIETQRGISGLDKLADKVIMCIPPGTGTWAGSAGVNHWRVQLNNDWCRSLSGSIHELGHTMGLLHARGDNIEYNDRTGYMGSGYSDAAGPIKCFNGYNSYKFGWYSNRHLDITVISTIGQLVQLATFVDYNITNTYEPVIININNTYYLQYNRKKLFNSGTEQKIDQVTITQPINNNGGGTNSIIGLSAGNRYEVSNFNQGVTTTGTLIIEACMTTIGLNGADIMIVSIALDKSLCGLVQNQQQQQQESSSSSLPIQQSAEEPLTTVVIKTQDKMASDFASWLNSILGK